MNIPTKSTALLSLFAATTFAGQPVIVKEPVAVESPFDKGRLELQLGASYYHSLQSSDSRPDVQDVGGLIRAGWMLNSPSGSGCFHGNWEFLIEGAVSGIIEGPGDVFASGALLLRYNFVQPDSKWVPYFQLGGGGTYSDMHEDLSQRVIGSEWSFNLQAGIGTRYLCSDRCAFFIEAMFRHISNADSADRNVGLNSIGAIVGVSLFY